MCTSGRERRLWVAVLVVVVAIPCSLVLGPVLRDALPDRDALDGAFALAPGPWPRAPA